MSTPVPACTPHASPDPRTWAVGLSTSLFGPLDQAHLDACREAGIQCLELVLFGAGVDPAQPDGQATLRQRAEAIRAAGLTLWSVHLPFGRQRDVASPDPATRQNTLSLHSRLLELAASWGASVAVVHPSAEPIAPGERAAHLARSRDGLAQLTDVARRCGITLAAECLPRTCLGNTSAEMLTLLDDLDDLRVCFDSNHLLQETPAHFVAQLGHRIATVHISDYDGVDERHWLPGRGVVDWPAVIAGLSRAGYRGPFLFELSQKNAPAPLTPADVVGCWCGLLEAYAGTACVGDANMSVRDGRSPASRLGDLPA